MKKTMKFRSLMVYWLAVFSVVMVLSTTHAADSTDDKDPIGNEASDDMEESDDSKNSIHSKVERLGKIKRLKVIEMRATQRNGLLQVQATILNGRIHQDIVYRTKWLDKDGFSVWDDEAWKPLALYARQKQNLLLVAPTPKAVDFRIELQRAAVHKKAQN